MQAVIAFVYRCPHFAVALQPEGVSQEVPGVLILCRWTFATLCTEAARRLTDVACLNWQRIYLRICILGP